MHAVTWATVQGNRETFLTVCSYFSSCSLPAAVPVVPAMQPADWLCCLLQLQLAAETNWLDTLPREHRNTEEEPPLVLTKQKQKQEGGSDSPHLEILTVCKKFKRT